MNHRYLSHLIIPSILFTTALYSHAEALNYGLVSFNTTASQNITRDEMILNLNIEQQGNNRHQISQVVTQRLNQVLQAAHRHHDFNTTQTNRSVSAMTEYKNGKRVNIGWQDKASIEIKSKNLTALNHFAAEVQQQATISNIDYQVAGDTLQQHENSLTQQAIGLFKQRAKQISEQLGGHGYKIVSMTIGNSGNERRHIPYVHLLATAADSDDVPAQDNAPGQTKLTLDINGQIQIY